MLSAEQAKKELGKFEVKDWQKKKIDSINRLPGKLKKIALDLYGSYLFPDTDSYGKTNELRINAVKAIASLKPGERLKLFKSLFPKIHHHVEALWQYSFKSVYQQGWRRHAFRAPNNPSVTDKIRKELLIDIFKAVSKYDEDIVWLAAWLPYIDFIGFDYHVAPLLTAAIESGGREGDRVFNVLMESARGEHEIGRMGRHVATALLASSRPEGWDMIENMLLDAERQEGLRQVILESADEGNPAAFKRMIEFIIKHNLTRFSSTVRAVNVWFGFEWKPKDYVKLKEILKEVLLYLEDEEARIKVLHENNPESIYLALWSQGYYDVFKAISLTDKLIDNENPEIRFAAFYFLENTGTMEGRKKLVKALSDNDERIIAFALLNFRLYYSPYHNTDEKQSLPNLFDNLEELLSRFPDKKIETDSILWDWCAYELDREDVFLSLIRYSDNISPTSLMKYIKHMNVYTRAELVREIIKRHKTPDSEIRNILLRLAGDASESVRQNAFQGLENLKLSYEEVHQLTTYLKRKASDLRKSAIALILRQEDSITLHAAARLINMRNSEQNRAGIEILREMHKENRKPEKCASLAKEFMKNRASLSQEEKQHLDAILGSDDEEEVTLKNCLGLINNKERTWPGKPRSHKFFCDFRAAGKIIDELDTFIMKHSKTEVKIPGFWNEERLVTELFGNLKWSFPHPHPYLSREDDAARLPLKDLFAEWYQSRTNDLRDKDGLEFTRAALIAHSKPYEPKRESWLTDFNSKAFKNGTKTQPVYDYYLQVLTLWFLRIFPNSGSIDYLLTSLEEILSMILPGKEKSKITERENVRNYYEIINAHLKLLRFEFSLSEKNRTKERISKYWHLLRIIDEPYGPEKCKVGDKEFYRKRPELNDVLWACKAGAASEADLIDLLIGERDENRYRQNYPELFQVSHRNPGKLEAEFPGIKSIADKCRKRILEVEIKRGDLPTPASFPALALRYTGGMDVFLNFLKTLGNDKPARGWTYDKESRASVFSHIIRSTFPGKGDTSETFKVKARDLKISESRLLEGAVYAPQWSKYVEKVLGWEGFASGVWWIHAHTKDSNWSVDREISEAWAAEINAHTPIKAESLLMGAVDVNWFREVYEKLGEKRWQKLESCAKYSSGGSGHSRAKLFARAMLGKVDVEEAKKKIREKRNKDYVRALGLIPVKGGRTNEKELLERYKFIAEFIQEGKKFGPQRRKSEKIAADIALENLSETAGYRNPVRFEWAMEILLAKDISKRLPSITIQDYNLSLSINDRGLLELTTVRNGKTLKSVPSKIKKDPEVLNLQQRKKDLNRQVSRMRSSLEESMIREDIFTAEDLSSFKNHPLLRYIVERLLFIFNNTTGFPNEDFNGLVNFDGKVTKLKGDEELRLLHPFDLLESGNWIDWQKECFRRKVTQPFKQVFRELYVITEAEKEAVDVSPRYRGYQIQQQKAAALLGARGWVVHPEDNPSKTFHKRGITARLLPADGIFTPLDVEDLTVDGILFHKTDEWIPLSLEKVPPVIFSEVMRDADLIVSVAHSSGFDPDASTSTMEMRKALADETIRLLKLDKVSLKERHVLIEGSLATYSVHLGSGVTHMLPGSHLLIVPIHSQHRGKIFLPFADDDPKTAEILSIILLLARDSKIKDPTILEQIR